MTLYSLAIYPLSDMCDFAAWFGLKYWNKDDDKDETR